MILRKCTQCGLEAKTKDDLELFRKNPNYPFGRANICKQCVNKKLRKGGEWCESQARSQRKWHPIYNPLHNPKKIRFSGKRILLRENPRTNICSQCGRRFPEELKRQTNVHHIRYDSKNPLDFTVELCNSCHAKLHHVLRKLKRKNDFLVVQERQV